MSSSPAPPIDHRIAELERQVKQLQQRVAYLERLVAPRRENPTDQAVVQQKVVYDWQG